MRNEPRLPTEPSLLSRHPDTFVPAASATIKKMAQFVPSKPLSAVRSELAVAVRVGPVDGSAGDDAVPFVPWMSLEAASPPPDSDTSQQQ